MLPFIPLLSNYFRSLIFFHIQDFPSQTLTNHRTAGEGRGPSFIPLYHFHRLTNIQTFICNFACEMTITYPIYHLIDLPFDWLIGDVMFVCLFDDLILGFCYRNLTWETGGFELASTITLVLQANRLTKYVNHSKCVSTFLNVGTLFCTKCINSFMTELPIMKKTVHWFAVQVNGLVAIW